MDKGTTDHPLFVAARELLEVVDGPLSGARLMAAFNKLRAAVAAVEAQS